MEVKFVIFSGFYVKVVDYVFCFRFIVWFNEELEFVVGDVKCFVEGVVYECFC